MTARLVEALILVMLSIMGRVIDRAEVMVCVKVGIK